MKTFLVNYQFGGEQHALKLQAADAEEAKARLNSLIYGRVLGEVAVTLPASLSPFASLICSVRNAFAR
jgi:hypothetical protein